MYWIPQKPRNNSIELFKVICVSFYIFAVTMVTTSTSVERYDSNQTMLYGFEMHLRADAMPARQRVGSTAGTSRPAHISSTLGYRVSPLNHTSCVTKRSSSALNQFRASTNECNHGSPLLSLQQVTDTQLMDLFSLASSLDALGTPH